jgi:hypothetical protein
LLFIIDLAIFYTRNPRLYYYTLFTLSSLELTPVLRMAAGTLSLLYLIIKVNGFFLYYPLGLIIMLVIGILKGITKNSFSMMYHIINIALLAIGCVIMYLVFNTEPLYLLVAALTIVVYQTSAYHETTLTNYLRQLTLQDYERLFIHLSPRLAFYVKKFYGRLKELEDFDEEDDIF